MSRLFCAQEAGCTFRAMIRVALIGYGLGGRFFHAPLIAVTRDLRLDVVVTSDPERRAQAAAEYPEARLVSRAEDVFSRPSDVDLVVITTPNRTHARLVSAALEAGLAVVVDKPMAPTSAEAKQLVAEARRRRLFLTVYHNRRWDGDFRTVARLVADGTLGNVHRFESRFERWRPSLKGGWRESSDRADAGGLLYDLGSHLVDQALQLFGPVEDVYAEVDTRRQTAAVDDDTFLALTHANGVRSHLWMSVLAADRAPRFRVFGRNGTYTKYGMDVQEDALRSGARPDTETWGEESRDRWGVVSDGASARPVATERGAYQDFYAGVARSLATGAEPPVKPEDAVSVIEVIERARAPLAGETPLRAAP